MESHVFPAAVETVAAQTHSKSTKTSTIILRCSDLLYDIDQRLKDKAYCSEWFPNHIKIIFYPNCEATACTLDVKVDTLLERIFVPTLDITVSVVELNDGKLSRDFSLEKEMKNLLVVRKETLSEEQLTASFPNLVDHKQLRQVSSEFIGIQACAVFLASGSELT